LGDGDVARGRRRGQLGVARRPRRFPRGNLKKGSRKIVTRSNFWTMGTYKHSF
jgi:hypothetical protein